MGAGGLESQGTSQRNRERWVNERVAEQTRERAAGEQGGWANMVGEQSL